MTEDRHRETKRLFLAACEQPPQARAAWLEAACQGDAELRDRVLALLDADGSGGIVDRAQEVVGNLHETLQAPSPVEIAGYRIVGRLGEGGMGVVYDAEQDTPRRRVALKVLAQGRMDERSRRRFQHEIELLGRLQHPGVAQLFEAGTDAQGRLFLAMERIDGAPLLLDANRRALGVRERVQLLVKICRAVHHAHQKGVIHRDLKPGNILVEPSGQPKVVDFGIARPIEHLEEPRTQLTVTGQLIGTLAYMSPEQVEGDPRRLDTRTDLYSLGVVAYELLSGRRPHELDGRPLREVMRIIAESPPPRLGQLVPELRGDLETIVGKLLAHEPERRYESADQVAEEFERWLNHEPITARPASTVYLVGKYVRRNRVLVLGVAATVVSLAAGLVASLRLNREVKAALVAETDAREAAGKAEQDARRDAAEARAQSLTAGRVSDFLVRLFEVNDPGEARGNTILAREILDRGVELIDDELAEEPRIRAALLDVMGSVHRGLGLYEDAEDLLGEAADLWRREKPGSTELAGCLVDLAETLHFRSDYPAAEERYREALAVLRGGAAEPALLGRNLDLLGRLCRVTGRLDEAEALHREALDVRRAHFGDEHFEISESLQSFAFLARARGDVEGTERFARDALEMRRRLRGPDDARIPELLYILALEKERRGEFAAARAAYQELAEVVRRVYGEQHVFLGSVLVSMARMHREAREWAEAEAFALQAIELAADNELLRADFLFEHEMQLALRGRLSEAESLCREILEVYERVLGPDSGRVLTLQSELSSLLMDRGRPEEAVPRLEEVVRRRREREPGTDFLAQELCNLGSALVKSGRTEDSLAPYEEAWAIRCDVLGEHAPETLKVAGWIADQMARLGRTEGEATWRARAVTRSP